MARSRAIPIGMSKKVRGLSKEKRDNTPGVYEIVNMITGRRYVGASVEPFARIGVYCYYLKNYGSYFPASPFFGSMQLKLDIEEHGFGTDEQPVYEFNILEFTDDIAAAKIKWHKKFRGKTYNRSIEMRGFKQSVFYELNDEMRKLEDERYVAYHAYHDLIASNNGLAAEFVLDNRLAIIDRAQKKITTEEFLDRRHLNAERKKKIAQGVKAAKDKLDDVSARIQYLHGQLVEQYSDVGEG